MATVFQRAAILVNGKLAGNASKDIDERIQASNTALENKINANVETRLQSKLDTAAFNAYAETNAGGTGSEPVATATNARINDDGSLSIFV